MIIFADIERAAQRIAGVAHRTPVMQSRTVNARLGAEVYFKCENFQRMGAFKFRGAYNAIAALPEPVRARGVLAYSSGNHAQAVALVGQLLRVPSVIIMPQDAPVTKLAATREYGAEVVLYNPQTQSREALAQSLAQERGLALIPPFDHPDIAAGQGTAALELLAEVGPLDVLLVCLGGGGLLAGSAVAAKHLQPHCQVYGVEPEAGNDGQLSLRTGKLVQLKNPDTIADGARTAPCQRTLDLMLTHVRDVLTVSDDELLQTLFFLLERMKILLEPTGVLAAAAALHGKLDLRNKRVGIILSGGNVDVTQLAAWRARQL
jgi:threo-3-hydroxy-L-aspartate ammonia-lyase